MNFKGQRYGQGYERAASRGQASSTEYLFCRASPASRRPHLGLQHIQRSPWLATGRIFEVPSERDLRRHDFKLRHRTFRLLRRKAAFSVRLPISWNKLPMEMINVPTLDTFKLLLDLAWPSLFPCLPCCVIKFCFTWFEAPNSAVVLDQYNWFDTYDYR